MAGLRLRPLIVLSSALLLAASLPGAVSASTTGASINTAAGECSQGVPTCGPAVYGTYGFSGRLFGAGSASLMYYMCVRAPGAAGFTSFPGTYTLTVSSGGRTLGATTYLVAGGQSCATGDAATGMPVEFTYPASGSVEYSVSIGGVLSANSARSFGTDVPMLSRVVDLAGTSSPSGPISLAPQRPAGEVPEAPAALLLLLVGGAVAAWSIRRRPGAPAVAVD